MMALGIYGGANSSNNGESKDSLFFWCTGFDI